MLVAHTKDGHRVCALDHPDLRARFSAADLRCPDCGGELVVKQGYIVVPHFAHRPDANCSPLERKNETIRHLLAKKSIRDWLVGRYSDAVVEIESRFPDVRRIADVCAKLDNGAIEIHEAQFASITIEEIDARTTDYERAGAASVTWWFGGEADTRTNRAYAVKRCGHYGQLEVIENTRPTPAFEGAAA